MLESLFKKVAGLRLATLIKKKLQQRCYPVNIAKFLRTVFYRTPPAAASDYFVKLTSKETFILSK